MMRNTLAALRETSTQRKSTLSRKAHTEDEKVVWRTVHGPDQR